MERQLPIDFNNEVNKEITKENSSKVISMSEHSDRRNTILSKAKQDNLFRKAELFSKLIPDVHSKKK